MKKAAKGVHELYQYSNKVRKVINNISTRCLTLGKFFKENNDAVGLFDIYFVSNFDLNDEPTEKDPDEKPSREQSLVNAFKKPVSKLYAMSIQSIIAIFDSSNTFLQNEEPLIHILYHSTLCFCRSLLSRFILREVISESDDVVSNDLEEPDVLKDFNSMFIGKMTKLYPRDSDIIVASQYKKFWKEVRVLLNVQRTSKHQCQC